MKGESPKLKLLGYVRCPWGCGAEVALFRVGRRKRYVNVEGAWAYHYVSCPARRAQREAHRAERPGVTMSVSHGR